MKMFPPPPTKPFKRSKMSMGPVKKPTVEDDIKDETFDMSAAVDALEHFVDPTIYLERPLAAEEGKKEDDEEGSSSEDDDNTKPQLNEEEEKGSKKQEAPPLSQSKRQS